MIRALGIDIGQRHTGFAIVERDLKPRWPEQVSHVLLVKAIEPPQGAKRLRWMREITLALAQEFSVDVVGYEQASYPRNVSVFRVQAQLAGAIEEVCAEYEYLCIPVAPTTAKKRLAGSGKADKVAMRDAAAYYLHRQVTEDEADALGVALAVADMVEEGKANA